MRKMGEEIEGQGKGMDEAGSGYKGKDREWRGCM